jgi:hypothetical protein
VKTTAGSRALPASITVDHGPEYEGQVLDAWTYARGVRLSFIRPGKPVESTYGASAQSLGDRTRTEFAALATEAYC